MKYTLLLSLLFASLVSKSQIFWTENFNNGCSSGCLASSYSGPNGAWTTTSTGTNDANANAFYVSCAENGHTAGGCGTGCVAQSPTATLATLHLGSTTAGGDNGASYNAGGLCPSIWCVTTNVRAESPVISCLGKSNITLRFVYIEDGDGTNDNAILYYYNGSTWAVLTDLAKTPAICPGGQGLWTEYSVSLPASADNNANVKIGFNWTNNDDGVGTDPSFAVDSITLSAAAGGAPVAAFTVAPNDTICLGQCLTFTDASTNTPTSWAWTFPGAIPATSSIAMPSFVCYTAPGTYTVTLTATNGSGSDTETHKIVVRALPHPHLTAVGHTFTCTGGPFPTYQWLKSGTPVGTSSPTYTATANGIYYVAVTDTNGCTGFSDSITVSDLAVQNINSSEPSVNLFPNPNTGTFTLTGTIGLYENTALIEVTDMTGRLVMKDKIEVQGGIINKQITLEKSIAKGMYMLKLSAGANRYVVPFRKD